MHVVNSSFFGSFYVKMVTIRPFKARRKNVSEEESQTKEMNVRSMKNPLLDNKGSNNILSVHTSVFSSVTPPFFEIAFIFLYRLRPQIHKVTTVYHETKTPSNIF